MTLIVRDGLGRLAGSAIGADAFGVVPFVGRQGCAGGRGQFVAHVESVGRVNVPGPAGSDLVELARSLSCDVSGLNSAGNRGSVTGVQVPVDFAGAPGCEFGFPAFGDQFGGLGGDCGLPCC